jgi:hypothetical protein
MNCQATALLMRPGESQVSLQGSAKRISPEECLVLEDSLPGVEAGRRCGMRVIWAPHPGLATEYRGREKEVLAGRIGLVEIGSLERLTTTGLNNFPAWRCFLSRNMVLRHPKAVAVVNSFHPS